MGPVTSVLAQGFGLERGERTVDVMRPGGFDRRVQQPVACQTRAAWDTQAPDRAAAQPLERPRG